MIIKSIAILVIIAGTTGIYGFLDFTCRSKLSRIYPNRDNGQFIGGYKGGNGTDAPVIFGRAIRTNGVESTIPGLPSGSERNDFTFGADARIFDMPEGVDRERVGAFFCQATKGDDTELITTIVMARDSVITPEFISHSVSIGDSLTLTVHVTYGVESFLWRRNGMFPQTPPKWNNEKSVTIPGISIEHDGIYDVHERGNRTGYQAIFQVIVRTCMAGKWGPDCASDCPFCFNGGICDERSGHCVCAPGFMGNYCETVLGSNRWGQDGRFFCSDEDPHSTACRGSLFCLPHPYGCSCAAGFYGIDCDQVCSAGYFGAGCKLKCHCASGVNCSYDTGVCDDGHCADGWTGINCQQAYGFLNITSVSSHSRIDINGDDNNTIGLYKNDKDIDVMFGRLFYTHGKRGTELPPLSTQENALNGMARILKMRVNDSNKRVGVFYCEATINGATEKINTIVMDKNSVITPEQFSKTVSIGESVTFKVATNIDTTIVWRGNHGKSKNGINWYTKSKELQLDNVTIANAGVYECYPEGIRTGTQAIFQLLVRACESGKWGFNCSSDCPICLNGGICDERSGLCVCAPGFIGKNCETVLKSNRWGQNGRFYCSDDDSHSTACRGSLFCLPHPYGCSCAAGFYGIDCDQGCSAGYFGAGCKLKCHCAPGVNCSYDTGECVGGRCDVGWTGVNCQHPKPITDITLTTMRNTLQVDWEPEGSPCLDKKYMVDIKLVNDLSCESSNFTSDTKETSSTALNFTVKYHSVYEIDIKTILNGTLYMKSSNISVHTPVGVPSAPPTGVMAKSVKPNSITFQWSEPPCKHRKGPIISYSYFLRTEHDDVIANDTVNSTFVTIDDLTPYTNYSFEIAAGTSAGKGPFYTLQITSKQSEPSVPTSFKAFNVTKRSISVSWSEPEQHNGIITGYMIITKIISKPYENFDPNLETEHVTKTDEGKKTYTLNKLTPSTQYALKLSARTIRYGPVTERRIYTKPATVEDIPKPDHISIDEISEITTTTIILGIEKSSEALVTLYQVGVQLVSNANKREASYFGHALDFPHMYIAAEFPEEDITDDFLFNIGDNNTYGRYLNAPLKANSTYELYIGHATEFNNTISDTSWSDGLEVSTLPHIKESLYSPMSAWLPVVCVIIVLILLALIIGVIFIKRRNQHNKNADNGESHIGLSIQHQKNTENTHVGVINKTCIKEPNASSSKTATVEKQKASKTSGSSDKKPTFEPVSPDASTKQPTTLPNKSTADASSNKASSKSATTSLAVKPTPRPKPIKLEEFYDKVQAKREANLFKPEFETLPGDKIHPCTVAENPENKTKNRYCNIVTFDHSRVALTPLEDVPNSDYINASFLDGMYKEKQYIACQGPNMTSKTDFWRMIWQYNVRKCVMLTNLVENAKAKCDKYWPDKAEKYGELNVTNIEERTFTDCVIRTFNVFQPSEETGSEAREVYQYHFTAWPDMGVPEAPSLLRFMKRVNRKNPENDGPTIVHCSAGVGRTGSYITVEEIQKQAIQEGSVDIYAFVSKMRNNRMKMVQTALQYKFIFDVLLEAFLCKDTSIPVATFQTEFTKIKKENPTTKKSGIEEQFQALDKITTVPKKDKFTGALKDDNASKNRFPDIIPTDSSRPYLMTQLENRTNYINAAYIDGTQMSKQHIVTQMPLPSTVADIWRLVYDYNFSSIVMLNTLDTEDPSMTKYWPDKGDNVTFGPLTIECTEEDTTVPDVMIRTFNLSKEKEESRTIRQFALLNWPSTDDKPKSPESVLALMECLNKWQKECNNQRVTVHCINGVGVSCVFLAIMLILEQLDTDDDIDVFQTVRKLRLVRPQAVQNLEQYTFCYEAIQAHFDCSSGIYENYRSLTDQPDTADPEEDADIYANVFT